MGCGDVVRTVRSTRPVGGLVTSGMSSARLDRAAGVLIAMACGDALGAGYEFGPPLGPDVKVAMVGGGTFGWEPGEWTDDTAMAIALAEVAAQGLDLLGQDAQDQVAARWADWARNAKDVGLQTRSVLVEAGSAARTRGREHPAAADLAAAAVAHHERSGRSGGNGSLMRTAPIAVAYLHDPDAMVRAAHRYSALTHRDPEAGEACAMWCLAIRYAVLHGSFDGLRLALDGLPPDRRLFWSARLDVAEASLPAQFAHNGWVVEALQGAWSAITVGRGVLPPGALPAEHLRVGLEAAVRGGRDTDTVAAIAGSLLGAVHGASAVPASWQRVLHGWPGLGAQDLVALGMAAVSERRRPT